jgi:hypothetical protein
MKAIRTGNYQIDGYGYVNFIKVDIGSGHSTYKVFWRREGAKNRTRIAWLQERQTPSAKLALFFCKKAYSLEDRYHEHNYYDKGLEPPKKDPLMRFTRLPRVEQPTQPSARPRGRR